MLQILLDLFDECSDFDDLDEQRKKIRKECCGIHYGGKATILVAMGVLDEVWIPTNATSYSKLCIQKGNLQSAVGGKQRSFHQI